MPVKRGRKDVNTNKLIPKKHFPDCSPFKSTAVGIIYHSRMNAVLTHLNALELLIIRFIQNLRMLNTILCF